MDLPPSDADSAAVCHPRGPIVIGIFRFDLRGATDNGVSKESKLTEAGRREYAANLRGRDMG